MGRIEKEILKRFFVGLAFAGFWAAFCFFGGEVFRWFAICVLVLFMALISFALFAFLGAILMDFWDACQETRKEQ